MFQIHPFRSFVHPFAAWAQRVARHGGFTSANCLSVCQSGHLWQSMLLSFSAATFSSGQDTRICQCHPESVSFNIRSANIAEHNIHGEIRLEARVLRLSASLGQEHLDFSDGHIQPLSKGVDRQGT